MGSETASRAAVHAPLGFVTLQTARPIRQRAWTGLDCVGFFDQGNGDACRCRLVGDVRRCRPCDQRPIFCWLLVFERLPSATSRSSPITSVLTCRSLAQFTTARLILCSMIAGAALLLGQETTLTPLQAAKGARAVLFAGLFGTEFRQTLDRILRIGTQRSAGDDDRLLAIRERGRVNLAQVYRGGVVPEGGGRRVPSSTTACQV